MRSLWREVYSCSLVFSCVFCVVYVCCMHCVCAWGGEIVTVLRCIKWRFVFVQVLSTVSILRKLNQSCRKYTSVTHCRYAFHKNLTYFSTECIYSPNAYRGFARAYIKDLERIQPSAIIGKHSPIMTLFVAYPILTLSLPSAHCGADSQQPS